MNNACRRSEAAVTALCWSRGVAAIVAPLVLLLSACSPSASGTCTFNGDCPAGDSCISQKCVATPKATCTAGQSTCSSTTPCSSGNVCNSGCCVLSCSQNSECASGQTCTSGACVAADGGMPATSCTSDSSCSGTTPVCDTTSSVCVECNSTADCAADPLKMCTGNSCLLPAGTCESNSDCSGSTAVCDTTINTCVGCASSGDCAVGMVCSAVTETCVQCIQGSDCSNSESCINNVCTSGTNTCTTSTDCAGNPAGAVCDTTTMMCVACNVAADCGTGMVCTANTCTAAPAGCTADSDCTNNAAGQYCKLATSMCVQCLKNADCPGATCDLTSDTCNAPVSDGGTDAGPPPVMDGGMPVMDGGTPILDGGTPVMDGGTTVMDGGTVTTNTPVGGICTDLATPPVQSNCAANLVCETVGNYGMCSTPCTSNNQCGKNGSVENYCDTGVGFCLAGCSATVACPSSDFYCDDATPPGVCLPTCQSEGTDWCTYGQSCEASGACGGTKCQGGDDPATDTCPSSDICYEEYDNSDVCVAPCTATSCPTGMTCSTEGTCTDYYAACGTSATAYQCQGSASCILASATATTGICLDTCLPGNDGVDCPSDLGASECGIQAGTGAEAQYFCAVHCGPTTTCPTGTTCTNRYCQ